MDARKIDAIMDRWKRDPEFVTEMLQDVQDTYRHLPEEALRHIAHSLDVPLNRLYHIGTFFSAFSLEEKGKHVVQVCMGTACHVRGGRRVLEAFSRELDVPAGGTTADKAFTVEPVRCLGCCSLAPAVMVDGRIYSHVSPAKVPAIIDETRRSGSRKGAN